MIHNKKIGIWGFGVVGKAALNFLRNYTTTLSVMDKKMLSQEEQVFLSTTPPITFVQQTPATLEPFLQEHDIIIVSPGIDIRPYAAYHHRMICELDLFCTFFSKPTIAITGTVGKTSTTSLLSALLASAGKQIALGGNIGTGMLELINHQDQVDYAVLELSSFQLEYATTCAPDLVIWTNFYPNHLDRHSTVADYFAAKMKSIAHQRADQRALLPLEFLEDELFLRMPKGNGTHAFFSLTPPDDSLLKKASDAHLFWIEDNTIVVYHNTKKQSLMNLADLPTISFPANWLTIVASLWLLKIPLTVLHNAPVDRTHLAHRCELVATVNTIEFYNDSKSTVPQATLAAVATLTTTKKPLILFLGGMSKGVDRSMLIAQLAHSVAAIYCFGKEAELLHSFCQRYTIRSSAHATLQEAFAHCVQTIEPHSCVLFSPAGSSYDLFAHYQERGDCFRKLVMLFQETI